MIRKHLLLSGYKYEVIFIDKNLTFMQAFRMQPSQNSIQKNADRWKCEINQLIIQEIKNEK